MLETFSSLSNTIAACNASGWNGYDPDEISSHDTETVAAVHIVASSVSVLCCLVVLGVSAAFDKLRHFPNNMLLWKTGCDLLTSMCMVGINVALLTLPQTNIMDRGARICENGVLAGLVGFSLLASPGWCVRTMRPIQCAHHDQLSTIV